MAAAAAASALEVAEVASVPEVAAEAAAGAAAAVALGFATKDRLKKLWVCTVFLSFSPFRVFFFSTFSYTAFLLATKFFGS